MTTIRPLHRPPITEALVDIRAVPARRLDDVALERLKNEMSGEFPKVERRNVFNMTVERRPGVPPKMEGSDGGLKGFFFESPGGKEVAQFRVDGFTYNRMPPYEGGDRLIERALDLWALYKAVAQPLDVTRVALRYINHIRLPPASSFDDYVTSAPKPPEGVPGLLQTFLARVTVQDPATAQQTIITQSAEPAQDLKALTLLIDIDASRTAANIGVEREDLRATLQSLRHLKNTAFFGAVTERALKEFCS